MSTDLTHLMKLALRAADERDPNAWFLVNLPRFHRGSIRALESRGLVEYDRYHDRFRLTDSGRSAAAELKGAS